MRFEQNATATASARRTAVKRAPRLAWWVHGLIVVGFVLLISALAVGYVKERQKTNRGPKPLNSIEAVALKELSQKKEDAFEEIKLSKGELTDTELGLIDEAVESLEKYNELVPADFEQARRLEEIRRRQHIIHAERLRARSRQSEALAEQDGAEANGVAQKELKKAIEAEKEIEKKWYISGMGSPGRITQLDTRLRRFEAEPIWKKTRALEVQAESFFKDQRRSEAEDCLQEAIRLERQFTENYRDVLNTEFNRLDKLNGRLETMRSYPFQQELERIEKEAIALEAQKEWARAAAKWEEAIQQISKIIIAFPMSQYASTAHEKELVKSRNFAHYRPETDAILIEVAGLRKMLRLKQVDAATAKARVLQGQMSKLEIICPGLFPETNANMQEVDYITKHEGTMRVLLPLLDRVMLPIPNAPNQLLLKNEVPQSLFSLVRGKNPSAMVRGTAPVESVSYEDALTFCREVSWMTARVVRLPRLAEIKSAAGDLSQSPPRPQAWTFDNTDGLTVMDVATSQANASGFYDIIGNVEEWVESDANTSVATVVGGNVNWVPTPGLPQRQAQKKERSRTLGFRFVIEN